MQPFKNKDVSLALSVLVLGAAIFIQGLPPAAAQAQPGSAPTTQSKATVYVYRYREFSGSALQPSVYCDDTALARIQNGRYFAVKLDPGSHSFRSNDSQSGVQLDLRPGQEYFLRVEIAEGMWKGHGRIVTIMPEQGRYELRTKGLKPLDTDKVNDKTRVSTAELRPEKSAEAATVSK